MRNLTGYSADSVRRGSPDPPHGGMWDHAGGGPSVRRLMVGTRVRGVRVGGWHALNVLRLTVAGAELTVTPRPRLR